MDVVIGQLGLHGVVSAASVGWGEAEHLARQREEVVCYRPSPVVCQLRRL